MRVLITGATGFLGRAVAARFLAEGWEVCALTRRPEHVPRALPGSVKAFRWDPASRVLPEIPHAPDAVIHLAGESIAGGRWTRARKERLWRSRVDATDNLIDAMKSAGMRPAAFVSASGAGYHGDRGDDTVRVADPPGACFLGRMAAAWEGAARGADILGSRTVSIRLGMVLGHDGGALPKMLPPFRFGLGAVLGSGRQWWPWIHRDDAADLFFRAATDASLADPLHGVAGSATNRQFSKALAGTLRRPLFLRVPDPVLRLALGEMADLFLHGQRIEPDPRFAFQHGDLAAAMRRP